MSIRSANAMPLATSGKKEYGLEYFLKGALAGGLCCGVTHGAVCPVDVVKTRMQLDSVKYNKGMIGGFKTVIAEEGVGALATGLGPTAVGYFIQGWFKFGGVEFFKIQAVNSLGEQGGWDNRTSIYLGSAAAAETIADVFLCPLEAVRIRLVSEPTYGGGSLPGAAAALVKENGIIGGFYSGFIPMLFKQVPYTMAKFVVQGKAAEAICTSMSIDQANMSGATTMGVALSSGVVAGVVAAIISHPADTLLSKVNKAGAGGSGGMMSRLSNIAGEIGIVNLCTVGLGARCVMIGTLTAGQFAIFDSVMGALGASKYHFHDPSSDKH